MPAASVAVVIPAMMQPRMMAITSMPGIAATHEVSTAFHPANWASVREPSARIG